MPIDQPVTTYSDTVAQVRLISDFIFNLDPMDTPVVARLGLDSANSKFKFDVSGGKGNVKIELLEDTFHPLTTALSNGTVNLTTTTLSFGVADGTLLQDGHIIQIGAEYMVVSGVSSNTVTVDSRAYGGTNSTHEETAVITIVGMARKEGDDSDYVGLTSLSNPYNYTSIFQKALNITGSEQSMKQYGKPGGEMDYQEGKAIPELARWIERAFFHSQRRQGTAAVARSMGGIGTYVTANSSSITTTLTKAALDAVAQAIYNDGGMPDLVLLPVGGAQTLHNLMDSSSFVRIEQTNDLFGMRPITRINTQFFANLDVLVSRHAPANRAYVLDSSKVGFFTYRPFQSYDIAKVGDSDKREVVTEASLLVANGATGHGYIPTSNSTL